MKTQNMICIENDSFPLTLNKVYEIQFAFISKEYKYLNDAVRVIADDGKEYVVSSTRFKPLREIRNNTLTKILQ